MLKQQHYTLTNVKKVKSQSTTPLRYFFFKSLATVGLQIYKMINLGSNVIVYKLKHCGLHFEVNMMTF